MTTPAHRLPIHGECRHDHHTTTAPDDCQQALETLTDVWAALNRAGATGHATPAELIDQLAGDRDQARAALADAQELIATLDHVAEQLDRARARYATRPGSPAGSTQDAERDRDATYPPIAMQAFLDYSTAEWRAARTADERWAAIRDLLEGWYDRWDAHYPGAVTDEHDGIARHLVALINTAEAHASEDTAETLIRRCVYPGCPRTYRADVGPQDQGWIRLRGLTVLCPDHSTYATGRTQDIAPPAESHTRSPGDPGAGVECGALPTGHSGPVDPETGLRTGGFVPAGGTVVLGHDDSGCVIPRYAAQPLAADTAGRED